MFQNLPTLCFVAPKTFVIDSCDQIVAVVLKENGWKQISKSSNSWNLKWTWKVTTKEHEAMQNGQIINHFKGSDQLSTKIGLNLLYKRNPIVMDCGRSFTNFYPRSYNLSTQKSEFIHNFIQTGIFNLLKKIIVCLQIFNKQQYELAQRLKLQYRQKSTSDIIHFLFHKQNENITDKNPVNQKLRINGKIYVRLLLFLQNMFSLQEHFDFQKEELMQLCEYSQREIPFEQNEQTNGQIIVPSIQSLTLLLIYHAKCMKMVRGFYEDGFSNIWVVKSNHSSRGRNIALVDKLEDVENLDNGMKLIQKYIQNIWILHEMTEDQTSKYPTMTRILKKKFDMRFWVLVKSFSPLTVYIYNEAYLRVSSESYRLDGLSEKNSHLTNFSVNWKSKQKFGQAQPSYVLFSHFLSYLKDEQSIDVLSLTKRIHEIILQTLKLVQIKSDQKCFQLFGFDIILDAKLNPWILECNMSPACSPRGELRNIVKQMTTGLLSILGLIESNNFGWKVLYDQKKKSSKINTVCRILKQTAQNFTTTKTPLKSPSTQLTLTSQRLKWRKYRQIQHLHYITQKIIYIQRYIKQKRASQPHHSTQTLNISNITDKNENKNENTNKNKSGTRVLMMIQILSRVIKRTKKNQWAKFMPITRRKLSKKKSKFV